MPVRNVPENWETIAAVIGARVRSRREELELTQEELAHRAGISRNQIQNIEHSRNNSRDGTGRRVGGVGNPRLDTIWAISVALEIDVAELVQQPRAAPDRQAERR